MFFRIRQSLILFAVAFAMTLLFWWPLYRGAGFIGGDLYPYFFPQKAFYSDCLKSGLFPLWNDLAGFGYPVLGESQTGAAYPLHFVLYRSFELNTAYNIEHLLHYVICFVATWLFARRMGLAGPSTYLTALIFTYGWFPTRACLEWAILTGAWLPVALWCVESFLQTRLWRFAFGLSFAIGLQLLAGHFHLAFITQLLVVSYTGYRVFSGKSAIAVGPVQIPSARGRYSAIVGLSLALIAGVGLASVQVLPTWELKQRSSRVVTGGDYDPAYGHMPPMYATQIVAPWNWYSLLAIDEDNFVRDIAEFVAPWHWFGPRHDPQNASQLYELDRAINQCRFVTPTSGTNKVEAHCYCGIVPVWLSILLAIGWMRCKFSRSTPCAAESVLQQTTGFWLMAGLLALIYATGFFLPIGRHLPGFRFFRGPGRYGIVTTLAIALLAGEMLGRILKRLPAQSTRLLLTIIVFASTTGDLWLVSRMVKYTVMVSPPRISFREDSVVRKLLLAEPAPARLLAPGPNVCNLLGISCVPWYLGIAPAEYVDPQNAMPAMPKPLASNVPTPGSPELIEWLSRSGVTHVLNFEPLDEASWNVVPVWSGQDPLLNRVWGRFEPIYLYRFRQSQASDNSPNFPGRAYSIDGHARFLWTDWRNAPPGTRRVVLDPDNIENATIVLTELAYPGWTARQGEKKLEIRKQGLFRAVEINNGNGEIVWTYEPWTVYIGAIVSLLTLFLLAAIAHLRYWHPSLLRPIREPL
jgi:hypothetical protein